MVFITGDKSSSRTTTTSNNADADQFAAVMKNASTPAKGSPDSAKNGTEAAKDLLSSNNSYFYNPLLFKTDSDYNPDEAKAGAFAATLHDYEQKGNNADIRQLLDTLGPAQAAQLFAQAGNLQGPQVNDSGVVFAQNQKGLDQVLGQALRSPGVQLGDGTRPGTLASSLLQQATQSSNNASSIAGILNQSGTSTQAEALKNQFLDQTVVNGKACPPLGADPTVVASWWAGLTPGERQALLASDYNTLGQLHGLPATVLNIANRHRLSDHITLLRGQLASPLRNDTNRAALQHQLDQDVGIKAAADQIGPGRPPAPVLLLRYDPTGTAGQTGAELAFGNPDTASNTAVLVPGTGSNASKFLSLTGRASDLYQQMSGGTKAVVTWLDGAEPQSLPAAAGDGWANEDTDALVADLNGLRAAHASASGGVDGHLTAIGHSYGSYILGRALTHGASVDDAAFIGSPGVGVNHASDLGMDPQHVWDGEAGDDPILLVAKRFTSDPGTGNNPEDSDFGAQHFSVHGSHGHSEYFQGESLINMARIASGDYTAVDRTPAPNYRGPLELPGDVVAANLDSVDTDVGAVKDLVTGHPIDAGKRILDGTITEGKAVINTGEDVIDGIKSLF